MSRNRNVLFGFFPFRKSFFSPLALLKIQ
jgi:hypothetical protein